MKINKIFTATKLEARIIHDNLVDSCQLYYQMTDDNGNSFEQGNIDISGDDYLEWDNTNEWLFNYIAKKLNLEICTL